MDIPDWIQQEVRQFGARTLHMPSFGLNDAGMAGVVLESGVRLRIEFHDGILLVYTASPCGNSLEEMTNLLLDAHPRRGRNQPLHVGVYNGQAIRMLKLPGEDITARNIEMAFRILWKK